MVLTSVKALIWPFAASTLWPKQSDKVMDLCYSLEQCVKGEESQQEKEEHKSEGAVVLTYCAAVVLIYTALLCSLPLRVFKLCNLVCVLFN